MTGSQILLMVVALGVFALALHRGGPSAGTRALRDTGESIARVLPIMLVAIPMAALLSQLIPPQMAAAWLGPESGMTGILVASAVGGFIPGGPFVSFPLVLTFIKAGAGAPQMVALITAWGVLGVHRVLTWELPVLGPRFAAIRLISGAALPVLAGVIAQALMPLFPHALPTGIP
jgi:uncharacterized membrane protein YraQ (UPF0718 family)